MKSYKDIKDQIAYEKSEPSINTKELRKALEDHYGSKSNAKNI